jgi:DivIVA domain-containing protein
VEYQLHVAEDRAAEAACDTPRGPAPPAIGADVGQQGPESAPDPDVDGAVLAEWVETTIFSDTRLRPGYDQRQVFAFLNAIRDSFLGVRKPSLTPDEIQVKQFSTTRLGPGCDQGEVDAFLEEAGSRLAVYLGARREASAAEPESGGEAVQIRCLECGAESAEAARVCARCGAPIDDQRPVAAGRSAGAVSDPASWAGPADPAAVVAGSEGAAQAAATAYAIGQTSPGPYVPGRGDKVPARLRRVPRGYSWMAWGAVFCGWALLGVGGYFQELSSPSDRWYFLACIAPGVLAAVLFSQHIRWSLFFRRPGLASSATVAACQHGGRMLMLDAPCDGYPSDLEVRLAWWAEPERLLPGEKVTFCGRRDSAGKLLVTSSAPDGAFVGTGRRRPSRLTGEEAPQDVSHRSGGQRAGRRYLRWGPLAIFGLGLVAAVVATLIGTVPALTGQLSLGQLRPGDCLTGSNLGLGTGSDWPWVTAVPCTSQHLGEVFFAGNAWPQSMAYPGDSKVGNQADARCNAEFVKYGTANSVSAFTYTPIIPGPADDWASGDRWLVCVAYESTSQYPGGAPVAYSIKGSQQASPVPTEWKSEDQLQSGDCLNGDLGLGTGSPWPDSVAVVRCTQQHAGEVLFAGNAWPQSMAYPGDNKLDNQAQARCDAAFLKYDGMDSADSNFSYDYLIPDDTTWPSGDRFVVCVAYAPNSQDSGAVPLNYSIKGSGQ